MCVNGDWMVETLKERKEEKKTSRLGGLVPKRAHLETPSFRMALEESMQSFGEEINKMGGEEYAQNIHELGKRKETPSLEPVRKNLVESLENLV